MAALVWWTVDRKGVFVVVVVVVVDVVESAMVASRRVASRELRASSRGRRDFPGDGTRAAPKRTVVQLCKKERKILLSSVDAERCGAVRAAVRWSFVGR